MKWFGGRRARREAELDEEIRSHFRMAVEERVARGESRAAAEQAVRREFGNELEVKELTRAMWGGLVGERLWQDVRYAVRSLRRTPAFTAAAVVTLALGIGANTAVFTVVRGVLMRPLPFHEPERLLLVSHGPPPGPFQPTTGMSDRDFLALRGADAGFERVTTFGGRPVALTGAGEPVRLHAALVTTEFFAVLDVPQALGRGFSAGEDVPGQDAVVVLSDALWRTRFAADPNILGRTVTLDGVARTVIGVMPPGFDFPNAADMWLPLEVSIDPGNTTRRPVVARMSDEVGLARANAAFVAFVDRLPPAEPAEREVVTRVQPLAEYLVGRIRHSLLVFLGAVAFVLMIACANVANLQLMRAAAREREFTVRTALGAGRGRLVRQLLTESVVLALAGGVAGVLLARAGVELLLAAAPAGSIPRADEIAVDGLVLAVTALTSIGVGVAFGLLPSLSSSKCDLRISSVVGGTRRAHDRGRGRSALALGQIALALVLLTGAGLLLRSFRNLRAVELGFTPANVLTMTIDLPEADYPDAQAMRALHDRVLQRLQAAPGVQAAGAVNWRPFGDVLLSGDFTVEGGPADASYWADKLTVSPAYFDAMGIPVLRGRRFTAADRTGASGVAIVSRSVANTFWPGGDAVGGRLALRTEPRPEDWLTVVGVVEDVLQREITGSRAAAIYQPYAQVDRTFFLSRMTYFARTAAPPHSIAATMRDAVRAADPNLPVHTVASMDELVAATTHGPRLRTALLVAFSLIALALAAVGVYGVLAYAVAQRRFEIGLRMALGAHTRNVVVGVLKRTVVIAAGGVLLGAAGAVVVTRTLRTYLFQVMPTDPATFVAGASVLAVVALLAGWLPARRAARIDPAQVLRAD